MDQELKKIIEEQKIKIDAIYASVEKTRKYFLIMVWATIIAIVLPLVGLMFAVPAFLSNYTSSMSELGL